MALLDVDSWSVTHWITLAAICENEYCRSNDPSVALRHAATAYNEPAKNRMLLLCDKCAEEYYEHWDEMWKEYNRGRG